MTIRLRDHPPQQPGLHGTERCSLNAASHHREIYVLNPQTLPEFDEIERLQIRPFVCEARHLSSACSV